MGPDSAVLVNRINHLSHRGRPRPSIYNISIRGSHLSTTIMSSPPENSSRQPGQRLNVSRAAAHQTQSASPETGRDEKPGEDDARPMSSLMPQVNVHGSSLHDLMSARVWRNHVIWRAGVSVLKIERISVKQCFFPFFRSLRE